jgi:hypothetical protein
MKSKTLGYTLSKLEREPKQFPSFYDYWLLMAKRAEDYINNTILGGKNGEMHNPLVIEQRKKQDVAQTLLESHFYQMQPQEGCHLSDFVSKNRDYELSCLKNGTI